MTGVAGIVLAAGASERMAQPKQLLKLHGRPLLAHVVDAAVAADLEGLIVVIEAGAEEIRAVLDAWDVAIVENPDPSRGNWSSLRCGLDALAGSLPAMVLLADMPEVDTYVIDAVARAAVETRPWGVVTAYDNGLPSHPVVVSAEAQQAAATVEGPRRLWSLLVDEPEGDVVTVHINRRPPIDVDTPDAYVELLRRAGAADRRR